MISKSMLKQREIWFCLPLMALCSELTIPELIILPLNQYYCDAYSPR